jgi:hypothetical protein
LALRYGGEFRTALRVGAAVGVTAVDSLRIAELRSLSDAATPGPWTAEIYPYGEGYVRDIPRYGHEGENISSEDAAFIAESRNAIPELLDEIERLQK